MPYRICKVIEVESGHMLSRHPANCRFPHGHSRRIELVLEADRLDGNGMVCDFTVLKDAIRDFTQRFDHSLCVNTQDPNYADLKRLYGDRIIGFEDTEPTTEVMAQHIHAAVSGKLEADMAAGAVQPGVRLVSVRVWETRTSWAEYHV